MEHNETTYSEAALQDYKMGIGRMHERMPDLIHQYNAFTEACFSEGELTKKEKQLIALGISIATQDEYCIIYHTKGCIDQKASDKEVLEVVGIAAAFAGGAAMSQGVTLVQECLQDLGSTQHPQ
ncbi:carboxymuconolactone decarboxylase family protein [Aureibacillus halotolerans]|uniref:carboxymuconolactone decarboxylase family protein n=1 Tax=Aureibacillus halotolerans TaxID=1508390 RepID=UPI003C7C416F